MSEQAANDRVIRISHDEAMSDHVEDLLQRQRNMRGEQGMAKSNRKKWYYQNWLIFMLVGALGAFCAWAIIEPNVDDAAYLQGEVEGIFIGAALLEKGEPIPPMLAAEIFLKINGDSLLLLVDSAHNITEGAATKEVELSAIEKGQTIGVYVTQEEVPFQDMKIPVHVISFIDLNPPASKATKEKGDLAAILKRSNTWGIIVFALVAGFVGMFIGAADGISCRMPRRALLGGVIGLMAGLIGGFVSGLVGGLIYAPISLFAGGQADGNGLSTMGFMTQMGGRAVAWMIAGMAMGLGQGIALRSGRLLLYGFLGGIIGGLLGGLLFDPIDLLLVGEAPSAHLSRLVGFVVVGGSVGCMIGIVELLARDAWLRMIQGPLSGKEFLIFKDAMYIGSSPRSDIYVFNDDQVAESHAVLRARGEETILESLDRDRPAELNGRPLKAGKMRHGDKVTIGKTIFVFQRRQKK